MEEFAIFMFIAIRIRRNSYFNRLCYKIIKTDFFLLCILTVTIKNRRLFFSFLVLEVFQ